MHNHYYIDINGKKDGPHDLVILLRRIRTNKIEKNTLIYVGSNEFPEPAHSIDDLKIFFNQKSASNDVQNKDICLFTLSSILREGWRFTMLHNVMTVFAGFIVLASMLLTSYVVSRVSDIPGALISWAIFVIFYYMYAVFSLRLYRGQPISSDFVDKQLAVILPNLLFAAVIIAFMSAGGLMLLLIPALIVLVYYIFVPFLIIDRRLTPVQAMNASRLLACKHNGRYLKTMLVLILGFLSSLILIVPLPLTLPIFAGAIIKVYEELASS